MRVAITRPVPGSIARCELTHLERTPIDLVLARRQHDEYEALLTSLGCHVIHAGSEPELPDSVFVEDTAVVLDEVAILTRPGAVSRRGEIAGIREVVERYRPVVSIDAPGTIDGGDVLRIGRRIFVGVSSRTNLSAVEQLSAIAAAHGYRTSGVRVAGCLHLKSAATAADEETVVINPEWVDRDTFAEFRVIDVAPGEGNGANVLRIGGTVVTAALFPRTRELLDRAGFTTVTADLSELAKAEGALTCCSLVFDVP